MPYVPKITITDLSSFPSDRHRPVILDFFNFTSTPTLAHLVPGTFRLLYTYLDLPNDELESARKWQLLNWSNMHLEEIRAEGVKEPALGWAWLVEQSISPWK